MQKVLVVDDQRAVRTALELLFEVHDVPCMVAETPEQVLSLVATEDIGLVLQDMNFTPGATSGQEGLDLFRALRELDCDLPIVLMTAFSSVESAVQLVKEGASDYIVKPWDNQKLLLTVKNLLAVRELSLDNQRLRSGANRARRELQSRADLAGIVYGSSAMHELLSLAVTVAPSDAPVLITGPAGSGKERLAEVVVRNSRRKDKAFVKVNAGGLPDQLLEAELFGAEPGAFTGATKLRVGRFEAADGGTLFLDEIGNLSPSGQMRLLRVLQTGEFERLGSNATRKVDVRIVSATNVDLQAAVNDGAFRDDLYFRLNVIELNIAPLADRPDDILPLARHFVAERAKGEGRRVPELSDDADAAIEQYDWPGNVRELENRIQRAVLVGGDGPILPSHLGLGPSGPMSGRPKARDPEPDRALTPGQVAQRQQIEQALERAGGVVAKAAAELGLSRQALYRRMERLGLHLERRVRGG